MQRVADAILLIATYQTWIFASLGLLGVVLILIWWRSGHKLRFATFGLDRENLVSARNRAATSLIMIICIMISFLLINTFISPNLSELLGVPPTATPPLPTNTPLPTATPPFVLPGLVTATSQLIIGPTPTRTKVPVAGSNCLNPRAGITSPIPGSILSGEIEVRGNANVENFAFYEVQVSTLGSNWLTVLTDKKPIINGSLGKWDTRIQTPGEYALRLLVYNSTGKFPEPCTIPISIIPVPTKTPQP